MAIEILLPRLGWTMEEGTFVEWMKRDGDAVQPGDILYTVESDKSLNEVEAFDAGILRIPPTSPEPGAKIPVGTLLAYILQAGEAMPGGSDGGRAIDDRRLTIDDQSSSTAKAATPSSIVNRLSSIPNASPRARRIAEELKVDWTQLKGSGRTGRIVERDVRAAAAMATPAAAAPVAIKVNASPLAQRIATDLGVDLQQLAQALGGRRIEREDVERAAAVVTTTTTSTSTSTVDSVSVSVTTSTATPTQANAGTRSTMSHTRRVIAERMANSAHTTAPVTLHTEVDATELVRLREQLKADTKQANSTASVPSFNDLLAKIAAHALSEHPNVNVRLDGNEIVQEATANIGIAVDTERGLLVVVVRDVKNKGLRQVAGEAAQLIARAREGKAALDDLRGSTFTITNLGMYEIDGFTPIINLPECAILGVGRIAPKQVVVDAAAEKVAIRQMMTISLTFDHRLVDGAPAARFLQRIKQLIEQPYLWLVT